MATPAADWCNYGVGAGKSNYQIDYSTATGAGITTATPATLATSTGISNILYADASNSHMMLRSDVDVDVIATNGYPRTEGRERQQDGTTLRAFNPLTGAHWVECWELPTHLPPVKPSYVMLQMHDASGDIIEIALQPRSDFSTTGLCEIVARINGSSQVQIGTDPVTMLPIYYTWPKLVPTHVWGTWYRCRIYVGAIHSGSTGYEISVNSVTVKDTDNVNMPAMATSGANSYFKCGMYLQTKWTGSGTGGLETDRSEYGEAGFRDFRTSHNGETDTSVQVRGTFTPDAVSNVRWGTALEAENTTGALFTMNPALPASLADGDMMFLVVRARRTASVSPSVSFPSSPAIATGWTRLISTHSPTTGTSNLVWHNVRFQLFAKKWVSGDASPNLTYSATTTTDLVNAQIVAVSNSKVGTIFAELIDQPPHGLDLSNPSDNTNTITGITYNATVGTTVVGPTAALDSNATAGALALALIAHEINLASGSIGVVTGGSDGLTWAQGGAGTQTTAAGHAWANDWAVIPNAAQAVPAKQAAATLQADANPTTTGTQNGTGWGLLLSLRAAKRHRKWMRAAS